MEIPKIYVLIVFIIANIYLLATATMRMITYENDIGKPTVKILSIVDLTVLGVSLLFSIIAFIFNFTN